MIGVFDPHRHRVTDLLVNAVVNVPPDFARGLPTLLRVRTYTNRVLAYLEEARARFASLASADDERIGLRSAVEDLTARLVHAAGGLTRVRAETGPRLCAVVEAELRELGMEGIMVEVERRPLEEPGPTGAERVELLFSGGPGQAALPLSKVASGGELSRTMLACRSVMVDLDDVPTLVFDECSSRPRQLRGTADRARA